MDRLRAVRWTLGAVGLGLAVHLVVGAKPWEGDAAELLRQGNGKDDAPALVNDWLLEGMSGATTLDCTPAEVTQSGGGFCGLGAELAFLLPPIMWLRARRKRLRA